MQGLIHATFRRPCARLRLAGELDQFDALTLMLRVQDADDLWCGVLMVDAGSVTYVHPQVLQTLDQSRCRLSRGGGALRITKVSLAFALTAELAGYGDLLSDARVITAQQTESPCRHSGAAS